MTKVAVCIPWFDTGDEHRRAAFECVRSLWRRSSWPLYVSRFARERATARNEVALEALGVGADVLVFCDADTLALGHHVEAAVELAAEAPGLVYCYDLYVRLTQAATAELIADPLGEWPLVFERQYFAPPSIGCVALSASTFLQTGGLDESYRGWGYEDLAFADACQRVAPARRVPGPAFHLWHGDRYGDPFLNGATLMDAPLDADDPSLIERNRERWLASRAEVAA